MQKIKIKAFTLIELLVVIAIIGILSALIIIGMSSTTQKATIAKAQVFSNSLRNSLMNNIVAQYSFDDIDASDYDPTTKVMNNDVGNVPDSWLDNEGRAFNGPIVKDVADCISGKCLSFDGSNDYVDCGAGTSLNLTDNITISAWIKFADGLNQDIIGKGSGSIGARTFLFWKQSNNILTFQWTDDNLLPASAVSTPAIDNRWHNVVVKFSAGSVVLYVDALSSGTGSGDTTIQGSAQTFIGNSHWGSYPPSGLMDEVRIFNAAMPASQIQQTYFAGLNKLFTKQSVNEDEYQQRLSELSNNYVKQ
ncbi:MAG: LamG-like jellyroll fold domain-containing protein [Candidatus Paceibacterota bacterium]